MTERWTILEGDVRERIRALADESVDCVCSSPPYWGLRDYGVDGQIGLEVQLEEYLETMVGVFAEVRRVLKRTGVCWVNCGDTFIGSRKGPCGETTLLGSRRNSNEALKLRGAKRKAGGLKRKDLVGLPWRLAFALQASGWWLRSDIVWEKPCVTPESVKDRPTRSHEFVFLLSKSRRYYYDASAIAEPATTYAEKPTRPLTDKSQRVNGASVRGHAKYLEAIGGHVETRNARSVWTIAQVPETEEHTATFPPELARRCILAGCPRGGVVLDPFAGLATAGVVAIEHDRSFIGIELNPTYAAIARRRLVEALERRGEARPEHHAIKGAPLQLGMFPAAGGE